MRQLEFPRPFEHDHPRISLPQEVYQGGLTFGQKAADWVAMTVGSWRFIIIQSTIMVAWCLLNAVAWIRHWDPYPFIFLNLIVSLQGAYTAPLVMMSQNRQDEIDRIDAHNDYLVNQKVEEEIHAIMDYLTAQNSALSLIYDELQEIRANLVTQRQP
jgi:uncharacterized membrane protein